MVQEWVRKGLLWADRSSARGTSDWFVVLSENVKDLAEEQAILEAMHNPDRIPCLMPKTITDYFRMFPVWILAEMCLASRPMDVLKVAKEMGIPVAADHYRLISSMGPLSTEIKRKMRGHIFGSCPSVTAFFQILRKEQVPEWFKVVTPALRYCEIMLWGAEIWKLDLTPEQRELLGRVRPDLESVPVPQLVISEQEELTKKEVVDLNLIEEGSVSVTSMRKDNTFDTLSLECEVASHLARTTLLPMHRIRQQVYLKTVAWKQDSREKAEVSVARYLEHFALAPVVRTCVEKNLFDEHWKWFFNLHAGAYPLPAETHVCHPFPGLSCHHSLLAIPVTPPFDQWLKMQPGFEPLVSRHASQDQQAMDVVQVAQDQLRGFNVQTAPIEDPTFIAPIVVDPAETPASRKKRKCKEAEAEGRKRMREGVQINFFPLHLVDQVFFPRPRSRGDNMLGLTEDEDRISDAMAKAYDQVWLVQQDKLREIILCCRAVGLDYDSQGVLIRYCHLWVGNAIHRNSVVYKRGRKITQRTREVNEALIQSLEDRSRNTRNQVFLYQNASVEAEGHEYHKKKAWVFLEMGQLKPSAYVYVFIRSCDPGVTLHFTCDVPSVHIYLGQWEECAPVEKIVGDGAGEYPMHMTPGVSPEEWTVFRIPSPSVRCVKTNWLTRKIWWVTARDSRGGLIGVASFSLRQWCYFEKQDSDRDFYEMIRDYIAVMPKESPMDV